MHQKNISEYANILSSPHLRSARKAPKSNSRNTGSIRTSKKIIKTKRKKGFVPSETPISDKEIANSLLIKQSRIGPKPNREANHHIHWNLNQHINQG
jgi:hypothetical protein